MLVTFSTIGSAKIWDMETFELIQTLRDTGVNKREEKKNTIYIYIYLNIFFFFVCFFLFLHFFISEFNILISSYLSIINLYFYKIFK